MTKFLQMRNLGMLNDTENAGVIYFYRSVSYVE